MRSAAPYKPTGEFLSNVMTVGLGRVKPRRLSAGNDEHGTYHESYGGFLCPPSFTAEFTRRTFNVARVASRCSKIVVEGHWLEGPLFHDDSRHDGERFGGIQAWWLKETQAPNPTRIRFEQMKLEPKALVIAMFVTEEALAGGQGLEAALLAGGSEEMAIMLDNAIFENHGGAGKPQGILSSPGLITVEKEGGQTAGTIVPNNIGNMVSRLWTYSDDNACFFTSRSACKYITQNPLLAPLVRFADPGAPAGRPRVTLAGYPLIPIEQSPAIGTFGDLVLADCTQYQLGDKGLPMATNSMFVRYLAHERCFRLTYYVDGQSRWRQPVTPRVDTASLTQSAFVALETRA